MRLYSWSIPYGDATAMANNMREARKLIIAKGLDRDAIKIVKKKKPNISTNQPFAVNTYQ